MISIAQCRAARALIGWSAAELAGRAQVGAATVRRFESGQTVQDDMIEKMEAALADGGVRFVAAGDRDGRGGPGVRLSVADPQSRN